MGGSKAIALFQVSSHVLVSTAMTHLFVPVMVAVLMKINASVTMGGWMGLDCSITHCFGVTSNVPDVVCSGKGKCVSHNKCKCSDEFRGHKCQRPPVSE